MKELFVLYNGMWTSKEQLPFSKFISKQECEEMLKGGGYLVRNIYNWDKNEKTSFWYIIKDEYGGLKNFGLKLGIK